MKKPHLDTARLLAIRDGDTADLPAMEHLVSCARCRQAFDDTQWMALLTELRRRVEGGEHPDPDALIAYRSGALSPRRLEEVGRHLRSCDRCLAVHRRERLLDSEVAYLSPSPEAVAQVRRRFRPQLRRLGTVLVERLKDRLAVFFVPEPGLPELPLGRSRTAETSPGPERSKGHPASAGRRARRLVSREKNAAADPIEMFQETVSPSLAGAPPGEGLDEMAAACEAGDFAEPGGMALIGAGEYSLVLEPGAPDDDASLTLTVSSADSDEPVEGVRVESARREGASGYVPTDSEGKASLKLTPGRVEITVHVTPPVRFRLDFPD